MAYVNISLIDTDEVRVQSHPHNANNVVINFGGPTYISLTRDEAAKLAADLADLLAVKAIYDEVAA